MSDAPRCEAVLTGHEIVGSIRCRLWAGHVGDHANAGVTWRTSETPNQFAIRKALEHIGREVAFGRRVPVPNWIWPAWKRDEVPYLSVTRSTIEV